MDLNYESMYMVVIVLTLHYVKFLNLLHNWYVPVNMCLSSGLGMCGCPRGFLASHAEYLYRIKNGQICPLCIGEIHRNVFDLGCDLVIM